MEEGGWMTRLILKGEQTVVIYDISKRERIKPPKSDDC